MNSNSVLNSSVYSIDWICCIVCILYIALLWLNGSSFSQFSFYWIFIDLIDLGVDLICLIELKWMLCCQLKSFVSILDRSCFSYSILKTITFRFNFVIMHMLWLVTILIWLIVMVLCPIWPSSNRNTIQIIFNVILYKFTQIVNRFNS